MGGGQMRKGRLCVKRWRRLARMRVKPEVAACQDAALVQCTTEFDHAIRHRLHSKHARVLARPYERGQFDTTFAVVNGEELPKASMHGTEVASGWSFISVESSGEPLPRVLQKLAKTFGVVASKGLGRGGEPFVVQKTGVLAARWGLVFMFDDAKCGKYAARGAIGQPSDRVRIRLLQQSNKYLQWPTVTTSHQAILDVVRMPVVGSLRKLADKVRRMGFVNYFSLPHEKEEIPPIHMGACIVQGDYRGAVVAYLQKRALTTSLAKQIYHMWKTTVDWRDMWDFVVTTNRRVPTILYVYKEICGPEERRDYRKAFESVHVEYKREALLMLRNHIWNYMASMRLSIYGTSPVVGDVVTDSTGAVYHVTDENLPSFTAYDVVIPVLSLPFNEQRYKFPIHNAGINLVEEVLSDFGISLSSVWSINEA